MGRRNAKTGPQEVVSRVYSALNKPQEPQRLGAYKANLMALALAEEPTLWTEVYHVVAILSGREVRVAMGKTLAQASIEAAKLSAQGVLVVNIERETVSFC